MQFVTRTPIDKYDLIVYTDKSVSTKRQITWCKKNISCSTLAEVGYYESRNQEDDGVIAVMRVVVNRAEHHKWPNTIEGVVYHKCQFSYVCDGSLKRNVTEEDQWDRMYSLAYQVIVNEKGKNRFSDITHYHTNAVSPYWAKEFTTVAQLGDHKFYKCSRMC